MKLPVEKQSSSLFNQMVELGVSVRTAKAISEMLALSGKTASRVILGRSVKEAPSMLCNDMGEMLKVANPTPGMAMTEEEEEKEEDLRLATNTVKLGYALARNMGVPQDKAMMMAMYAHTRLLER